MKKFLFLLASSCISLSAFAELKVDLKGEFDFQSGTRFQEDLKGDLENVSPNQKGFAFYTEAYVKTLISNITEDGLEYGANIFLRATTNQNTSSSKNGSSLFISNDRFGKIEVGSPFGASKKMRVAYDEIEIGSGNWTNYAVRAIDQTIEYKTYSFYMDSFRSDVAGATSEPPRSITYYTPKMSGFQAGVTFTPDTSNAGGGDNKNTSSVKLRTITLPNGTEYKAKLGAKNVVSVGLTYENSPSEDLNFKVGVTGDSGRAIQKGVEKINGNDTDINLIGDRKIEDLFGYNVGAIVTYRDISLSASYADLGKSFSSPIIDKDKNKTVYFGLGAAYNNGPVGLSFTYGNTDHRKNIIQSYTLGTQYKLSPGLVSYADVTYFKASGSALTTNTSETTKGTILVFGIKLGI